MSHALVIGGTGMLRGVCLHLAGMVDTVSVVARNAQRLESLASQARRLGKPGEISPIAVDYAKVAELTRAIRDAAAESGPITLAVAWVHADAPKSLPAGAKTLGELGHCRLFHIMGSTAADPTIELPEDEPLRRTPNIRYRRVILGFVVEPAGASRWLTNTEIAAGINRAIELDEPESIVGTLRPWSARPS
jgi:hypothetical protein